MRGKRIISFLLVVALIASLSVSTAFADGWGKDKNKIPPGIAKKIFNDLDDFSWAKEAIEKMFFKGLIEGYGNGVYAPQKSVSKLEAIIMALRVMGWEDDSRSIDYLPKNYKGKKVEDWAKGYITMAERKGILDEVDLMYFDPYAAAKRHEVAKYVIRALGFEEDAEDNMDARLPFVDAPAVPVGSVGYVYMVNKLGLMEGNSNKRFNPMGSMTRAEMAVLFARVDDKTDTDDEEEYITGKIYRLRSDYISLVVDGEVESFDLDSRFRIYDGNKRIDYDDLTLDLIVRIKLDDDDEVVYIEIIKDDDGKIISNFNGTVENINYSGTRKLAIKSKSMLMVFEVSKSVRIEFEDELGIFDEIKTGDEVSVIVDKNNRAVRIYVHRNRERHEEYEEVKGTITDIDLVGIYHITIDKKEYDLSKSADVKIHGRTAELEDLEIGMQVEAELEDNVVVFIDAEDDEFDFYGEIQDIDGDVLTIELKRGKDVSYEILEDVKIKIDGIRRPDVDDLEIGDYGKFTVVNDYIVEIEIENRETEVEGILASIDDDTIEVDVDGKVKEYELDKDVKVEIKDHRNYLRYLEVGMKVELTLKNDVVYSIYAEDYEFEVEGRIEAITRSTGGVKLTLEVDDEEYKYMVSEDAEIEIDDDEAEIKDLKVDQEGEFKILNNIIVEIDIED